MRERIIAANWKMNHTSAELKNFFKSFLSGYKPREDVTVVVAPPAPYLAQAVELASKGDKILISGQNIYYEPKGAFTGEISAGMISDLGCRFVILGHSERRHVFGETDEMIAKKVLSALQAGLKAIFCIGELLEERESGRTEEVITRQLNAVLPTLSSEQMLSMVIAYEPVWAIGTGRTATPEQVEEVHRQVRAIIAARFGNDLADGLTIQYGGSVNPGNIDILMAADNIDGALVGGASLVARSFLRLVNFRQ